MSVACERLTKAPVAGNSSANATSRTAKSGAAATSRSAPATPTPPPTTTVFRQRLSPRIPNAGSNSADA
jgi:hypothetical protein